MKKVILGLIVATLIFSSCAHDKLINNQVVKTYGWADYQVNKNDSVTYKVSVGNVLWSILLSETVVVPVYLTGWELFEPIDKIKNK